ncbi:MAG TPA: NUDIX hydrolase [Elusimicrobiota bacterium]|nr:NUDIX hydrolase [Elusimicrobiota bacterium]
MSGASRVFSCRIYGVLREDGKVLLTRSAFRGSSFINFPGGGVEIGEGPMSALLREFVEETGLAVRPVRALYSSERAHLSTQAPIQIVSAYWLVERVGGKLRAGGNDDDVLDLLWADPARLPVEEMFPADREFAGYLPNFLD